MDLKTLWKSLDEPTQNRLAQEAGISVGYLYLIVMGHKTPGAEKAKAISDAAERIGLEIPRHVLRPDLWDAA